MWPIWTQRAKPSPALRPISALDLPAETPVSRLRQDPGSDTKKQTHQASQSYPHVDGQSLHEDVQESIHDAALVEPASQFLSFVERKWIGM